MIALSALLLVGGASTKASAQRNPKAVLDSWLGATPALDGVIAPGEWADAAFYPEVILGAQWDPQFTPVLVPAPGTPEDLNLDIYVKHDTTFTYFAFRITDNLIYGFQTERWTPSGNPAVNNLTQKGWPWFGDGLEVAMNGASTWTSPFETANGSSSSWQMVGNSGKSRLGGIGVGGLLEGEPRSSDDAWNTYQHWILSGAQRAAVGVSTGTAPYGGSQFVVEWAVAFDPCLELAPGVFYNSSMPATSVGLNIALQDTDRPEDGDAVYGLRHEMWLNGTHNPALGPGNQHTWLSEYGSLILHPGAKPR